MGEIENFQMDGVEKNGLSIKTVVFLVITTAGITWTTAEFIFPLILDPPWGEESLSESERQELEDRRLADKIETVVAQEITQMRTELAAIKTALGSLQNSFNSFASPGSRWSIEFEDRKDRVFLVPALESMGYEGPPPDNYKIRNEVLDRGR